MATKILRIDSVSGANWNNLINENGDISACAVSLRTADSFATYARVLAESVQESGYGMYIIGDINTRVAINSVKVSGTFRAGIEIPTAQNGFIMLAMYTHGRRYYTTSPTKITILPGETITTSKVWTTNPNTETTWTISEVNNVQLYFIMYSGYYAAGGEDLKIDCDVGYIEVDFVPAIPIITTNAATDITATSVILNGNITDDGGSVTTRGFEYYKEGDAGNVLDINESGDFEDGTYNLPISGLDSETKYYFRAYATNETDTGYGSWLDFTTETTIPIVTTEAASSVGYDHAKGNGTIVSGGDINERGFEVKLDFASTLGDYVFHNVAGFEGNVSYVIADGNWQGTLTKTVTETGTFETGAFTGDLGRFPHAVSSNKLFPCESYTYRAYATNDIGTGYGSYVALTTDCYPAGSQPLDDLSDGNPTVPIIPIVPIEPIKPIEWVFPEFIWEEPEIEIPPWVLPDLSPWEYPDYPPISWIGDFYYRKPYTKKDLNDLRKKCIIYNKNSVEFALVLRHNMDVLREFFNMMTNYMDKEEFNDFTDLIPPQRLKELYLDPLEINDFRDMINEFIRNTIDNNIAVNRNFKLIQDGLSDYETESDDAYFREINSNIKTVTENNPDVDRLKRVIDGLNQEVSSNFGNIMHNLKIVRARLL